MEGLEDHPAAGAAAPAPDYVAELVPAVAAPLLREGELFDNTYRLMRLLGEGAMGAVYEATHARLAGRYAIKLLLLKPTVGSEAIALFAREARITSLLQHPNIVQVIDHNTTADGTEYLVMEYLAGESLAQRLVRTGAAPPRHVVGIVDQIAAGLSAAHASRRRSPRSQAGQRVSRAGRGTRSRVGQDPGLRDLEGEGQELGPSGARGDGDGHAALHGARADRGARRRTRTPRPISSRSP